MEQRATATFLFSDIEGSTRLLQQLGEQWAPTLQRHREIMRASIAAHDGEELGTEGDSFFVAFPTASGAVLAAAAAQRALVAEPWPGSEPLRVRMGLHTGEGRRTEEGTFTGIDVHRAARIGAIGRGGQVLVSDATRILVDSSLPSGLTLRDLGMHRLKDLSSPEHLYQLVIDQLPSEFPSLRTLDTTPNNLPTQLSSFLGREREIEEVAQLLATHRMVTLTGPGGTGKTRLSLQVAGRIADRFADGVYFVPLSELNEVELVAPTIAHTLGLADHGGRAPEQRILDFLASKEVLLVLDNFEQLVPAAAVISELLAGATGLTALATSREPLHLYGEQEYAVPPLGLPPVELRSGQRPADLRALSQYEAVALFIERAKAVQPGFTVTNENAPSVAEICVRLDGLPLAIELAAARIRILSPEAMLRRLGDKLDLLSGGGSDRPARQQTLRGAIDWSHDLLDDADRRLFAGMAVFVGGATLDAVEEVCGPIVKANILDGVASLVDKSLVRQRAADGEPRFSLLLTIREYALDRTAELGIAEELHGRHAAFFARLAADAAGVIMGSGKRSWLDRLDLEHDNLRAAFSYAIDRNDAAMALELSANLWRFWQMRGYLDEGDDRVRQALALASTDADGALRLRVLEAAGGIAYWRGDLVTAERYYQEVLDAQREAGNEAGVADALYNISFVYALPSSDHLEDPARAAELVSEALAIYRRVGNRAGVARALWSLSNGSWIAGELERGQEQLDEALVIFRELDDRFMVGWAVYTAGMMYLQARRFEGAAAPLRESLEIFHEANDVSGYVLVLDGLAAEAYLSGNSRRAARLAAVVAALQATSGTGLTPANRELIGFSHDPLRADPALADDWAIGERMTIEEAVAYAIMPLDATLPG